MILGTLLNHLLQSTAVCALIGLLAFVLRRHRAGIRHGLWLVASLKFLLPFAALAKLGSVIPRPATPIATAVTPLQQWATLAQPLAAPFDPTSASRAAASPHWGGLTLFALWLAGFLAVSLYWLVRWRRMAAILRSATPIDLRDDMNGRLPRILPARITPTRMEPGIFGIFRPILLLPEGIAVRLNDEQLSAVVAHELCHVRRRDNLTAALHMLVECLFWFYPLVWWIGAKLVEERERACDENVLADGGDPDAYAEGLLQVCRYYLESPLACVAGITGADLKHRVTSIMNFTFKRELSRTARVALASALLAMVAIPLAAGRIYMTSPSQTPPLPVQADAPRFDVVSIKLNNGTPGASTPGEYPVNGTWERRAIFLQSLVGLAYNIPWGRVAGVPASFIGPGAPRFDISAKMAASVNPDQFRLMLQSMLADRFHFAMHWENRDIDVNILEVAKGGPKLQAASGNCLKDLPLSATLPDGQYRCGVVTHKYVTPDSSNSMSVLNEYVGFSVTTADLAAAFGQNMPVVDETGLTGTYDIKLDIPMTFVQADTVMPEELQQHTADTYHAVEEAFQKTLGLSFDQGSIKKRKLPTVVIDHIEMPTAD